MKSIRYCLWVAVAISLLGLAAAWADIESGSFFGSLESRVIDYIEGPTNDRIAQLQQKIDAGQVSLLYDASHGYLESLLAALEIDPRTQGLVFSKTSLQHFGISPAFPRAVYFNDDTYVGWVNGGKVLEIASADAERGTVFYTLKQDGSKAPRFVRESSCLVCHASSRTLKVPAPLVRSVYPDKSGHPILPAGGYVTNHRSPLDQRWGGWYVTGTHGRQRHMGNVTVTHPNDKPDRLDTDAGANRTDLSHLFNTSSYMTPHSDLVALMVLEHQTWMQTLLTRADFETRALLAHEATINAALDEPRDAVTPATRQRIEQAAESVLRYLLMVDEIVLEEPVTGTSGFADWFSAQGPHDSEGRSLRQLDLNKYLFHYPCSYMVYSPGFDGMHPLLKDRIYRRLHEILTGNDPSPPWDKLSTAKRRAVIEILRQTKAGLPDYYHQDAPAPDLLNR